VKAIILAHHGDIRIQSDLGKGSRFEISLPGVQEKEMEAEQGGQCISNDE
jgi:signal transduction histidine kinase